MATDATIPSQESSPPTLAQPRSRAFSCRFFLQSILLSLLISCVSIYAYDCLWAQKIVAVDLQGFLTEQKDLYLAGKIDDAELQRRMDHLEQSVTAIPERYAVILGDVVVRNVEVIKP